MTPVTQSFDLVFERKDIFVRGDSKELDQFVDKYYDPSIETKSLKVGGTDAKYGFAECGLPLILEHNTPNNSLSFLWAESSPRESENKVHQMKPLFRRRQRHG